LALNLLGAFGKDLILRGDGYLKLHLAHEAADGEDGVYLDGSFDVRKKISTFLDNLITQLYVKLLRKNYSLF
jgi:hypothetical protein